MKISLRWVCDHLGISWQSIDVTKLIQSFNTTVAEIESVEHFKLDIQSFFLGQITAISLDAITVTIPEQASTITLPFRSDVNVDASKYYFIKQYKNEYSWVTHADIKSAKEGLLRSVACQTSRAQDGSWRELIETEDFIFEVDNKSITHRPDMWGHRGIAREIAAILNVPLLPEVEFLAGDILEQEEQKEFKATGTFIRNLRVSTPRCKRISAVCIQKVANVPSALTMATRLLRVEVSAHNFIVDSTNYVMLDWGHPMHAFDAEKIHTTLEVRTAQQGEKLNLLQGTAIELTNRDILIADEQSALSLAGINGGVNSGISEKTTSLLLEAACFDAATIRLSSAHHKLRTDASARFEKTLDPHSTTSAIRRCLKLFKEYGIQVTGVSDLVSLGELPQPTVISISQRFIEERLGVQLPEAFVKTALEKLEFKVEQSGTTDITYTITVPTFRATKDVSIPEDIVEEVARRFGYGQIPMELPHCAQPHGLTWFDTVMSIKEFLSYGLGMSEVYTYALFNNTFIAKLQFPVESPVLLKNPLSQERTMLVTSLIPHLLESVEENSASHDSLTFFEWATIWHKSAETVIEQQVLAGIWYENKKPIDFYACKDRLNRFFAMLQLPVVWQNAQAPTIWSSRYQIADLWYENKVIGKAGIVSKALLHAIGGGDAFVFELDGDFLKSFKAQQQTFTQLPKYQSTALDVSVMVPLTTTVVELEKLIAHAEPRIFNVTLQDMFKKDDWLDVKSLTFRFYVRDETTTLDKAALDTVQARVHDVLSKHGAQVRS